ncbi:MAG: NAD-dependent epimerase/dehydratase family protein, partial [Candidatus Omnitrophica bacterium]|nr:NAD-dependent epimerase/dehydratase family protein [Candidatus Omnitrophota bacterium]
MRILVTGGAGFVGSSLAIGLKERGTASRVFALDNLKRRGSELNLTRLKKNGVTFVHGDVRNFEDLQTAGKIDVIIECSAEPSVLAGYGESPEYLVNTNLIGALNCFELARLHKAGVIFISTSRVYPIDKVNGIKYSEEATR